VLTALPEVTALGRQGQRITVSGSRDLVTAVIRALATTGVEGRDVQVESPSLYDAYVRLIQRTGHDPKGVLRP
jgi:hypothetical protein